MITPELVKQQRTKKCMAQCAICAGVSVKILKLGSNFAVVCKRCLNTFSKTDLELMHNMFVAYGGYFGSRANSREEAFKELEEIAKEYAKSGKDVAKVENDVKNLHRAFLHGITLVQLAQGLRVLSD